VDGRYRQLFCVLRSRYQSSSSPDSRGFLGSCRI